MVSVARARSGVAAAAALALLVGAVVAVPHGPLSTVAAIVIAPVGAVATALAAERIAGRRFAVGAALVYAVLPLLGDRYMLGGYRGTFDAGALPALVGAEHAWRAAVGAALAVALAVLPRRIAAAAGVAAALLAAALWAGSMSTLGDSLHESVWSTALLEWLLVAGIAGAVLRAPLMGIALGGWLVAVLLWAAHAGYDGAAFWGTLALAAPAVALCVSSVALLVPPLPLRLRRSSPATR